MKKQIMSIAAAAALFTTGAMAFDYTYDGEIVADITNSTLSKDENVTATYASYIGGEPATRWLSLSGNNKGDALIYPAFRAGEGWSSELVVRNAEQNATVCKVVLYAADNSRELLDFNIYLSPYDVFRFKIEENGDLTTNDGSFARIHESLQDDEKSFLTHGGDREKIGTIHGEGNEDVTAGYVIIYAMAEATNNTYEFGTDGNITDKNVSSTNTLGAYHGNHEDLFKDFRTMMDVCRDVDGNLSTQYASWRDGLTVNQSYVKNGTATGDENNVTAPNVSSNCIREAYTDADTNELNSTLSKNVKAMKSNFISPSRDVLFGDVTISTAGGEDPRNLLILATALNNYTDDNQMMLWADGEYAAIQDRRITPDFNGTTGGQDYDSKGTRGYSAQNHTGYSDYDLEGIRNDASTFIVNKAYYTFDDNKLLGANTLLITQPMKRALIMAGNTTWESTTGGYWQEGNVGISPVDNQWGEFKISGTYFDENENIDSGTESFVVVTSPVSGNPEDAYKSELQKINDPERSQAPGDLFTNSENNGFAIMTIGKKSTSTLTNGLPAIVTQMTGSVVGGESQINWVYSTTATD